MGRTKSDKEKLGKDWIDKLELSYVCHDFHAQVLKCDCISKLSDEEFVAIKVYFKDLVEVFWMEDIMFPTNPIVLKLVHAWGIFFFLPVL